MHLTDEQIDHVAALARLDVTPDEKETFRAQLSSVLEYVSKLGEADTTDVEPMSHPLEVHNVWRADVVRESSDIERNAVVDAFPSKEGDLLRVKAVFKQ